MIPLSHSGETKRTYSPVGKLAALWSILIGTLSVAVAASILVIHPTLLTVYFISTSVLTIITFKLKIHLLTRTQKISPESSGKNLRGWIILSVVATLVAIIISLRILDPLSWFIAFDSVVGGLSFSEALLFFYSQPKHTK